MAHCRLPFAFATLAKEHLDWFKVDHGSARFLPDGATGRVGILIRMQHYVELRPPFQAP